MDFKKLTKIVDSVDDHQYIPEELVNDFAAVGLKLTFVPVQGYTSWMIVLTDDPTSVVRSEATAQYQFYNWYGTEYDMVQPTPEQKEVIRKYIGAIKKYVHYGSWNPVYWN